VIVKPREKPLRLKILQALLKRTPLHHPNYHAIKKQLARETAGFKGEQAVNYPLRYVSDKHHLILHDIRLPHQNYFFQMDTLILSSQFFLILEIKNMKGTLFFDPEFHQLIQTYEGQKEVYQDPCAQVDLQVYQFEQWLNQYGFIDIPLVSLVISANSKAILKTNPGNSQVAEKVIRGDALPVKFAQIQKSFQQESVTKGDLKKLVNCLLNKHTPQNPLLLSQFNVTKDQLIKGVFCPHCAHVPISRIHGSWFCSKCRLKSVDAHIGALKDYALLIKSEITNREAREFLQLENAATVTKILKSLQLPYFGVNKGRVHSLMFED